MIRPSSPPTPGVRRLDPRGDQVKFGDAQNNPTEKMPITFQDKLKLGFDGLKKELQDPKSRNYLISGYGASTMALTLLLSAALFPVAAPILWPLAGISGFWGGVILWESFSIVKKPFTSQKAKSK